MTNHIIILTDAEKAFDKIQYQFMIKKNLNKVGIEELLLHLKMDAHIKPTVNIIFNVEIYEI